MARHVYMEGESTIVADDLDELHNIVATWQFADNIFIAYSEDDNDNPYVNKLWIDMENVPAEQAPAVLQAIDLFNEAAEKIVAADRILHSAEDHNPTV